MPLNVPTLQQAQAAMEQARSKARAASGLQLHQLALYGTEEERITAIVELCQRNFSEGFEHGRAVFGPAPESTRVQA
jgi:hypothetical protein